MKSFIPSESTEAKAFQSPKKLQQKNNTFYQVSNPKVSNIPQAKVNIEYIKPSLEKPLSNSPQLLTVPNKKKQISSSPKSNSSATTVLKLQTPNFTGTRPSKNMNFVDKQLNNNNAYLGVGETPKHLKRSEFSFFGQGDQMTDRSRQNKEFLTMREQDSFSSNSPNNAGQKKFIISK